MRIALGIEYDGAPFHGWQSQTTLPSVQSAVQHALAKIAGEPVLAVCAGRTDTGVHAREQVAHFDTSTIRPMAAWVHGVNAHLPASVVVLWARTMPENFHARFSALSRHYDYFLLNRPMRPALGARATGWFHIPLDIDAMREAARQLLGIHDFSALRSAQCQARTPVRHVRRLDVRRDGDMITFSIEANAFLHHMVRNIVGCLVYIGKGKYSPDWLSGVLESRDRSRAAPTFPPQGLYLARIDYGLEWDMPTRRPDLTAGAGAPGPIIRNN